MPIAYHIITEDAWNSYPENGAQTQISSFAEGVERTFDLIEAGRIVSIPVSNARERKSLTMSFTKRAQARGLTLQRKYDDNSLALRLAQ
jgi:hypothetical protein